MYGTLARMKIKKENLDKVREMMDPSAQRKVEGFRASYVVVPDQRDDEIWLLAVFEDEASYKKNAASPEQDKEFRAYRALLEDDPEWIDGQIEVFEG
jgi:quinol monooxygenase YgiN